MGRRGPKPAATKILNLPGQRAAAPAKKERPPACPSWLSREAKAEWRRVVPRLDRRGVLAREDRARLSLLCQTWGDICDLRKVIRDEGWVVDGGAERGPKKNPAVSALSAMIQAHRLLASEFGLSPASRKARGAQPAAGQEDPLGAFAASRGSPETPRPAAPAAPTKPLSPAAPAVSPLDAFAAARDSPSEAASG